MTDWDLLSSYAGLLTLAVGSVYSGAWGSLLSEEENADDDERISASDAWLFPIVASVTLLGLYLAIKYLGREWINWLLGMFFALASAVCVPRCVVALARLIVGPARWREFDQIVLSNGGDPATAARISLRTPSLFLLPLGVIPAVLYTFTDAGRKSVLLSNVLSISFCHTVLTVMKLDSFYTGCVLLSVLFFYDIWWVFGTEVMLKVATSLNVPIKLLWPKSMAFASARGYSMLGLGDVVVPGMFISLCLRYDQRHRRRFRHQQCTQPPPRDEDGEQRGRQDKKALGRAPRPDASPLPQPPSSLCAERPSHFFTTTLAGYALALATCMAVMHVYKTAQPALLYISPACIVAFLFVAITRGELGEAYGWTDEAIDDGRVREQVEEKEKPGLG